MRPGQPRGLVPSTMLILALLGGCLFGPSSDEGTTADGGGLPAGVAPPIDDLTGEPLEIFVVYDSTVVDTSEGAAPPHQAPSLTNSVVVPGVTTTVRGKKGVVELVFGPGSVSSSTPVKVKVIGWKKSLKLDFRPDGLQFSPDDPVVVHFFPHVADPNAGNDWTSFSLFHEVARGRFEELPSAHATAAWTDPKTGATSDEYCITTTLAHFSKYAVLR